MTDHQPAPETAESASALIGRLTRESLDYTTGTPRSRSVSAVNTVDLREAIALLTTQAEKIARLSAQLPTDGRWVLVPREPTEAMIEAVHADGFIQFGDEPPAWADVPEEFRAEFRTAAISRHRAMIAAAAFLGETR